MLGIQITLICLILGPLTFSSGFECPNNDVDGGKWPDPADCSGFYNCANGYPYRQNCPTNLKFDSLNLMCDWPEKAYCEAWASCPYKTLPYTQTVKYFDGRCFQFVAKEKFWDQARDYCTDNGGKLVKIDSEDTNDFITSTLNDLPWSNSGVWIGLHDRTSESTWHWTTESGSDEISSWFNWGKGHPGSFLSSRRDCIRMKRSSGWKWHETFCHALKFHYYFVCEYAPLTTTTISTTTRENNANRAGARLGISTILKTTTTTTIQTTTTESDELPKKVVPLAQMSLDDSGSSEKKGSKIGLIIGCSLFGLLIAVVILAVLLVKRRNKKAQEDEHFAQNNSNETNQCKDTFVTKAGEVMVTCSQNTMSYSKKGERKERDIGSGKTQARPLPDRPEGCAGLSESPLICHKNLYVMGGTLHSKPDTVGYENPKGTRGQLDSQYLPMGGSVTNGMCQTYDAPKDRNTYCEIPEKESLIPDSYPTEGAVYEELDDVIKPLTIPEDPAV